MSYILDALKRADAERERGTTAGVHAQPAAGWSGPIAQPAPAGRALWFVLGVATVLLSSIAWRLWGNQSSHPVAVEPWTTAAPVLLPNASLIQRPAEVKSIYGRGVDVHIPPPLTAAAGTGRVATQYKPTSPAVVAVVEVVGVKIPTPVVARTSPKNAVVDDKVLTLDELPEEIRRELPALTIGGAIYSENVANRFVIINGQIFHETETPTSGVILQKIKLKSAVLSFKGYQYSIVY